MPAQQTAETRWSQALGHDYTHGNTVTPFVDGASAFASIYNAIQTTHGSGDFIYILAWWLDPDVPLMTLAGKPDPDPSSTLRALLPVKAKAGVQIRVMMWMNWGKPYKPHDSPGDLKALVDNGVDPEPFLENMVNALATDPGADPSTAFLKGDPSKSVSTITKWINSLPNAAAIADWLTPRLVSSHHQKLVCVRGNEGVVALCGGVDVNADRITVVERGKGEPLHDVHCQVRGPAAQDLLQVFIQRWDAHPKSADFDRPPGKRLLGRGVPQGTDVPSTPGQIVRVATTFNQVNPDDLYQQKRRACAMERSTQDALLGAIASSRRFIYLEDQYLTSLTIADALGAAAKHLQFVIALITGGSISDLPRAWEQRKKFIDEARSKGLGDKLYVFYLVDPERGGDDQQRTYVHAKTWIFDDELAYIGSANVNNRGLNSDSEVGVLVCDKRSSLRGPGFAQQLRQRLWKMHLGVDVPDALKGLSQWTSSQKPQAGVVNRVMLYDPNAGQDEGLSKNLPLDTIDPDLSGLEKCQMGTQRVRQLLRKSFGS